MKNVCVCKELFCFRFDFDHCYTETFFGGKLVT